MVHHICIAEHITLVDGNPIPYGSKAIEEGLTSVISTMLDDIVPVIKKEEVVVCGKDPSRRMLGRKLEDRLKRVIQYE